MAPLTVYDHAFAVTLAHEGGFVDHPKDPGGATKHGVSLRWLAQAGKLDLDGDGFMDGDLDRDGDIDVDDIRLLSPDEAKALFKASFWDALHLDRLPNFIAIKTFNLAVNTGPKPTVRMLQRACRASRYLCVDDGLMGAQTIAAVAAATTRSPDAMMAALCSEAAGFYRSLVAAKPDRFSVFEQGWLNRAYYWPQSQVRFSGENYV